MEIDFKPHHDIDAKVRALLHDTFHLTALYPYQELAIRTILESAGLYGEKASESAPEHQLVVLPTGSGKSICFMLPSLMLEGITLVVYPLLALMTDQERRMEDMGFETVLFKGSQSDAERVISWEKLNRGLAKFVITNPETLRSPSVLERLSSFRISLAVIDEVHTITQWGETFRPAYLDVPNALKTLHPAQIVAFTATASPRIVERIREILFSGKQFHLIEGNPDRPNIIYRAVPSLCKIHDLSMLLQESSLLPSLVFCATRKRSERIAWELTRRLNNHAVRYYHAGLDTQERSLLEQWFFQSEHGILCSTNAYGMGVDKKNIRSVIHYDLSNDVESFLQESGRAGRDGKTACSIVLVDPFCTSTKQSQRSLEGIWQQQGTCRRQSLLKLMGYGLESCSGCDVCSGTVMRNPSGKKEILRLLYIPLRYHEDEMAALLTGDKNSIGYRSWMKMHPLFGTLAGWEPEDVIEAIKTMVAATMIRKRKRFPYKDNLYLPLSILRTQLLEEFHLR